MPLDRKRKHYLDDLMQGVDGKVGKKAKRDSVPAALPDEKILPASHYRLTQKQIYEREFPACMRGEASAESTGFVHTQPSGEMLCHQFKIGLTCQSQVLSSLRLQAWCTHSYTT